MANERMELLVALVLVVAASGATADDLVGRNLSTVVMHPIAAAQGPVTWDDGAPHLLPGTTVKFTPARKRGVFLVITTEGVSGIQCGSGFQFVGARPRVEDGDGHGVPFAIEGQTLVTPVLTPGTYTVGLSAVCQAPDDVGNPAASYQVSGYLRVDEMRP